MAINKVVYGGDTLIDLTSDTVTPPKLKVGAVAHAANGVTISGELAGVYYGETEPSSSDTAVWIDPSGDNIEFFRPLDAYPVGSIYQSINSTSPAELFGGSWEPIQGRFLYSTGYNEANTTDNWGAYAANSFNFAPGEMGGQPKHILNYNEMPKHRHGIYSGYGDINNPTVTSDALRYQYWGGNNRGFHSDLSSEEGGGLAHTNMPPYLVVYMWKRIA